MHCGSLAPAWLPVLLLLAACGERPAAGGPNVVVLMSDDQSSDTLGCAGHPWLQTPNLDRLAGEGVRFENAFVTTSVCSPARASFLTGLYVRGHGVQDNTSPLPADVTNVAELFGAAGWDTAYFGKWHMGEQVDRPGFAHSWSYLDQGAYTGSEFHVDGTSHGLAPEGFVDDITTSFAVRWLRKRHGRPFFAWIGFKAAHGPREPKPELAHLYEGVETPTPASVGALPPYPRPGELERLAQAAGVHRRKYVPDDDWAAGVEREIKDEGAFTEGSMLDYTRLIAGMDQNIGQLLAALDEIGLAENTIVVFVSDNGYLHGQHGSNGKRAAYEESLRVPFLLRWPAGVPAGQVRDELALNVDLAPTLLDLAGLPVPGSMQGRSLRGLLEGGETEWRKDFLSEYYRYGFWRHSYYAIPTYFAVRTERAKLVTYPGHPGWEEYFDLEHDPLEMHNLVGDPGSAAAVAALRERLGVLERELGPRLDPER